MNPDLARLYPYPFEQLRKLFSARPYAGSLAPISMSIGEPRHATPPVIVRALQEALGGLSSYPTTQGSLALREAIAAWVARRYQVPAPDPERAVLPVSGTREALFAIAQALIDRSRPRAKVVVPNPLYQIYEGAALLAGAQPIYAPLDRDGAVDYGAIAERDWADVQLVYTCSPGNPSGKVMTLDDWRLLFERSDRHGFAIVSDECYSEIYFRDEPPLGALEAATRLGRSHERLILFTSLSKRSNVPGMRSGFVAGDPELIDHFLLYRTYHGCALSPPYQTASTAAWSDEAHVEHNRSLYRDKFAQVVPVLAEVLPVRLPEAAFYLWIPTPIDDETFAQRLYAEYNVAVLPGTYLGRAVDGANPGAGHVRVALVATPEECLEAARRIVRCVASL